MRGRRSGDVVLGRVGVLVEVAEYVVLGADKGCLAIDLAGGWEPGVVRW
jgi:hypothetical protein